MTSWREGASPQAQQDLDGLLNPALGFAQQQLDKYGEFFPYAVVVRADGEVEMVAARPDGSDDRPTSADVMDACRATVAERRNHLRAAAVIADVRLDEVGDAIRVELEHTEGPALTVLLPYAKKRFGRGLEFGELRAATGSRRIWAS